MKKKEISKTFSLKEYEKKAYCIEYLRSVFGDDEHIHSFKDVRQIMDILFMKQCISSRTLTDRYYELMKESLSIPKREEEKTEEMEEKNWNILWRSNKKPYVKILLFHISHFKKTVATTYLEKCKVVGRLGPTHCHILSRDCYGSFDIRDKEEVWVHCNASFGSLRANTCVFKGRWYYEVKLMSAGLMQIGWCTIHTPFNHEKGVGDSSDSFAYDGDRVLKWNNQSSGYGEHWEAGDIIGCYIDLVEKTISFSRNGRSLGVAFKNIPVGENLAYFPGLSIERGVRLVVNFGRRQTLNKTKSFLNLDECDSESSGLHALVSGSLMEMYKRLLSQTKSNGIVIPEPDRQLAASLLWEYIFRSF